VQYNTEVDVKVSSDLILAGTRHSRIYGYGVRHKSKTEFWNIANITREYVRDIVEFIGDFKVTLPPIVEWNCTIYTR
jgi:hypothetical protein